MADNFSDKVVKKLQKQNLAVDLTEDVVVEAAPEEVTAQSQDFQTMGANDVTAFAPGSAGGTITQAVYKDIIITPGPGGGSQNQNTASQINFYTHSSAVSADTTGYDAQIRSTIYNYLEADLTPALVIGGTDGTTKYAPSTTWGGTTGLTVAKIWLHPFTGKVDASIFDGNKLVLSQTTNTPQISFGSTATTQTSLAAAGDLAWDGTAFKVNDGSSVKTLAYTSQVPGAQNIYSTFTDGTNSASPATTSDTFKFRGLNGVTVTVTNNDATHNDNLLISLSSVPNAALANSAVTIGSTAVSLGSTVTTFAGLSSVTSTTFNGNLVAGNIRINNTTGQIDTSSGNLTIDSTGGTTTIADNLTVTGTTVSFSNATTTTLSAANATVTLAGTTSTISANSNKITNVATPTAGTDAANKSYVDGLIQGLDVHDNVRAMAASAISTSVLYFQTNAASSTSGSSTGACYIESSANQALSAAYFDNITLNAGSITTGDRVLVTAGATSATYNIGGVTTTPANGVNVMNGIYVVTNAGSVSTKWRLDRALDSDDNIELEGGTFVFVQEGDVYKDTGWLITNNTSVTKLSIGSDAITFVQFSSAGQIEAGSGLLKNGNVINAQGTTDRISVSNDNIDIASTYAGQTSITTLGTIASGTWNATTIATSKGGTGLTSFTNNGVFYASSTSAVGQATGTSGQLLVANASNTPTFVSMSGGEATFSATGVFALSTTTVTSGNYGSSTQVATFSVDTKGRLTAAGNAAIPTATSSVLGLASFGSAFTVASGAVSLNTVSIALGGLNRTTAISGFVYGDGTAYAAATAANINSLHGSQSANTFYAAPNGSASTPSFRAIVLADLPTITVGKGGTGVTTQATNGITYYDGTNITSGSALTWIPGTTSGTTSSSALYVNAASLTSGTVVTINALGTATGKLISGSLGGTEKFSIDVNGNLRATTKSFDIPHPTKEGMRLVYGVLEGPEHGVYHRGTVEGKDKLKVELPEYWHKLVGENYSVQLTSWGPYAVHLVEKTEHYFIIQLSSNFVMRKLKTIKVDYVVHGARLDAPLEIEQ